MRLSFLTPCTLVSHATVFCCLILICCRYPFQYWEKGRVRKVLWLLYLKPSFLIKIVLFFHNNYNGDFHSASDILQMLYLCSFSSCTARCSDCGCGFFSRSSWPVARRMRLYSPYTSASCRPLSGGFEWRFRPCMCLSDRLPLKGETSSNAATGLFQSIVYKCARWLAARKGRLSCSPIRTNKDDSHIRQTCIVHKKVHQEKKQQKQKNKEGRLIKLWTSSIKPCKVFVAPTARLLGVRPRRLR